MRTLVIQSFRERDVPAWIEACLDSVRHWSARQGFEYRFIGDEIIGEVPSWYLEKAAGRWPVVTDYARLVLLRRGLEERFDMVIWFDADVLVFDPALQIDFDDSCAFGRETWIQADPGDGYRALRNVHNAVCAFRRGCPVLPFLERTTLSLIRRADPARIAPQMAGPKLLTALHNIAGFSLLPQAGAFSPAVLRDLAAGGGPALDLLRRKSEVPPQAANLCGSVADAAVAEKAVQILLAKAGIL